jgi:small nuclear ribonucleoprotein B and B'
MLSLINWRLKVTINDGRALTGQMLAFDRHMNLVLAECEEFRRVRPKKKAGEETAPEQEMKRSLGLVILRGETVVSISVEGPPPVVDEDKKNAVRVYQTSNTGHHLIRWIQLPVGPGRGMPAGRGMGMMPPSMCFAVLGTFVYILCFGFSDSVIFK